MGIKEFLVQRSKILSLITAWFVIVSVIVLAIVNFAVDHINFTTSNYITRILAIVLLLAQLNLRFIIAYFNFFQQPFVKGVYMISLITYQTVVLNFYSSLVVVSDWMAYLPGVGKEQPREKQQIQNRQIEREREVQEEARDEYN